MKYKMAIIYNLKIQSLEFFCPPGFVWILLGLQLCGGPGGSADEDHRETGGPQPTEPGGLCH